MAETCDIRASIAVRQVESLNVSVAAAIAMHKGVVLGEASVP